jgi:long-chain fatty acid transport protein
MLAPEGSKVMKKMTLRVVPALLLAAFSGLASAAAFQLWEQNASGLGNAYAGSAAVADNASTVFFNPAGMTQWPGLRLSAGAVGVRANYEFNNSGSTGVGGDGGNAGRWIASPNAYASWQLTPDLFLGFGISTPFGMNTNYEGSDWIGRNQALKSEIQTVNYNPSIAYRVNDTVSLGLGLNYQTIDTEFTSAGLRLNADDAAWGWNAGALFTLSPAMRVGISYRSAMDYSLQGSASGATPIQADMKLPDTFILSVWQQVSDRWEAMGDLSYTRWNSLQSVNFVNRSTGALVSSEAFDYDNAWRFAWGAAYKASDNVKLKFGIAYDRSPVSYGARTARLPDSDRVWFSLGGQWNTGGYGRIDAGYAYQYLKDASIDQSRGGTSLRGHYDASVHVLGMQYSVGF